MANAYGYYIVEIDGITLVEFGEDNTAWRMCDLEGGIHYRHQTIQGD